MSGRKTRQRWDIERLLIWALRDQGLGWVGKERQQLDFSDYGTIIDENETGSHPTIGLLSDDDATAVKSAVDQLPFEARVLVIQYCRAALRPPFGEEGIGQPQQMKNRRGQPMWRYADANNRRSARTPRFDMLAFSARKERIAFERAEYAVWWQALVDLVAPLNAVMETHFATGPEAKAQPWLDINDHAASAPDDETVEEDDADEVDEDPEQLREISLPARRRLASEPVQARAQDWGAPGTGEKPVRGPLTVVFAEPAPRKAVQKKRPA
ncbi:MAG TPA: hypothetical protein VGN60_00830 [Devosia sp.]|nr:hypothetical protein [Devosia sp.]